MTAGYLLGAWWVAARRQKSAKIWEDGRINRQGGIDQESQGKVFAAERSPLARR